MREIQQFGRRRRLSSADRRNQILQVAAGLFIEHGFEAVTMGDIGEALGIARPTVYSYFRSTTVLLDALFDAALESVWGRLEPLMRARRPDRDLTAPDFKAIFTILVEERELLAVLHSGGGPVFQDRRRVLLNERFAALLEPYVPTQRRPYAVPILTTLLEGMAFWAVREGLDDTSALAESLAAFVEHGLTGRSSPRPALS